ETAAEWRLAQPGESENKETSG
ncbi:MAG: hypothetical protein K0S65_5319, partial [Labilithrix sp.]|nr:hypothetical protein [Labilithrix sp.]